MACRTCEIRARTKGLGPCDACASRPAAERQRITSAEPLPAETFDPMDVLETSLRQARAIQRRLQEAIDTERSPEAVAELNTQHGLLARSIGQLVPTWVKLREAEVAKEKDITPADEEDAFVFWWTQLPASKQRDIWQRMARVMNEGKTA